MHKLQFNHFKLKVLEEKFGLKVYSIPYGIYAVLIVISNVIKPFCRHFMKIVDCSFSASDLYLEK